MIDGKSAVGVIPARSGSKRLPGKNTALLGGKPLIAWTVEAALKSRYLDRVIVSSDDPTAIAAARVSGAEIPFVRPAALATDEASSADVLVHAIAAIAPKPHFIVLLQPTSPFRTDADIDRCLETLANSDLPAALTVAPITKPLSWLLRCTSDGLLFPDLGYPDLGPEEFACAPNGAVYALTVDAFLEARSFCPPGSAAVLMPEERSIDIDTASDWARAEAYISGLTLRQL